MARHRGPSILCGSAPPRRDGESFSKIVLASPSEFPYSTSSHGGVAQLGERLTGSQEVRGSIPLVSTIVNAKAFGKPEAFFLIKRLNWLTVFAAGVSARVYKKV